MASGSRRKSDALSLQMADSRRPVYRARLNTNVRDLLEALNRLKVPFGDRISILEEIHRAGKLHARLMYEG